jgi:3-dehydroquinate synthase
MPTIGVRLGTEAYAITVADGALASLPDVLSETCPAARYVVIADETVAALYGQRVRALADPVAPCDLLPFPAGERHKTREQWQRITDAMTDLGLGRDAAVLALGGGVTGDLAGFVAATYRRGIPFVQIPTTVLAMLDSSIGGKTGVDTPHGKNLVGAFHHPRAVIADVSLLRTLPEKHLRAGFAEGLKHGAVADRTHFDRLVAARDRLLARDPEALSELLAASIAIKAGVVEEDAGETGRRAILNFGHTVGHALEAVTGYGVSHGEAVAVGMAVETSLGAALHITDPSAPRAVRAALQAFDLPTSVGTAPSDGLLAAMRYDKKVRSGTVRFAFLREIGQAAQSEAGEWSFAAPQDAVLAALSE